MGELERQQPQHFLNVVSGELIDPDDLPAVAKCLEQLEEHRRQFNTMKRFVEDILIQAAREYGTKTLNLEGRKAVVSGGTKIEWDIEKLDELQDHGLPSERFAELVTIEQTFRVNANVAKSIAGAKPEYAAIIEAARSDVPAPERVKIISG